MNEREQGASVETLEAAAGRGDEMSDIRALTDQLCELTKRWTPYEDIPRSQQAECRDIGRKLHALGAEAAMRDAYYEATGRNRAAMVIAAYFDGIGEWRW